MSHPTPRSVELRYTCCHGLLVREDGRTSPLSLDAAEQHYGRDTLDRVMESAGEWIPVALPDVAIVATVNGRQYAVSFEPAASLGGRACVADVTDGTINVAIGAMVSALVEVLGEVARYEPLVAHAIDNRPVRLDPEAWGEQPAA